jgi:hypothetical protein
MQLVFATHRKTASRQTKRYNGDCMSVNRDGQAEADAQI